MAISWRESLSVGVADVDSDHKALFTLAAAMERAVGNRDERGMALAMQTLVGGISSHFSKEERILGANDHPRLAEHRAQHDSALERIFLLRHYFLMARDPERKCAFAGDALLFLVRWLERHIQEDDADLKPGAPMTAQPNPAPAPAKSPVPALVAANDGDVDYALPPHLDHLLRRLAYQVPVPGPAAFGFESFEQLCAAAIRRRIDKVLLFFQRSNPAIRRDLPPPFVASPDFARRFGEAVELLILPSMLQSRQFRQLESRLDWQAANTDSFWDAVDGALAEDMWGRWAAAWDDLRLVERIKEDGGRVFQVKPGLKILREMLIPSCPHGYDLLRIGNVEIGAFRSLFDPRHDLTVGLEAAWRSCHDFYEQEMEPRVFQQRARDGALRDYLLSAHAKFSDHWGEFLILTCHRVFGRVSTRYLERLTFSLGKTPEDRLAHMPFLIGYLAQLAGHPHVRRHEREDEERYQAERQDLQKVLSGRDAMAGVG
jgi:hemerythrin-like metal-binding protein